MPAPRGPGSYRAPMRSRLPDLSGDPERRAVDRALEHGVVGVGGRLSTPPEDLDAAVDAVRREHDERTAARLQRFAEVPEGAEVWTMDGDHLLHRGTVTGGWRYDADPAAHDVDLVHVRPCTWHPGPVDAPPAAVVETFERGGLNFQRIRRAPTPEIGEPRGRQ